MIGVIANAQRVGTTECRMGRFSSAAQGPGTPVPRLSKRTSRPSESTAKSNPSAASASTTIERRSHQTRAITSTTSAQPKKLFSSVGFLARPAAVRALPASDSREYARNEATSLE